MNSNTPDSQMPYVFIRPPSVPRADIPDKARSHTDSESEYRLKAEAEEESHAKITA